MPTPLVIFSADWHLAPGAWKSKFPGLAGDAYFGLEQIANLANEMNVKLMGAGDLFDTKNPDSLSVDTACKILGRVNQGVYYIQGDHEISDPPWLRALNRGEWFHNRMIEIGNYRFYGLDFAPAGRSGVWIKEMPTGMDFLVTHQKWRDLVPNLSGESLTFDAIPYGLGLLTGDCHATLTGTFKAADGSVGRFVSPGTLCVQAIDEQPNKVVYALFSDGSFAPLPIKSRRVQRIQIESEEALTRFLSQPDGELFAFDPALPSELHKPLFEVRYDSTIPVAHDRLVDRLTGKCYFQPVPVAVGLGASSDWAAKPEVFVRPIDLITPEAMAMFGLPPELAEYARRLWETADEKELTAVIRSLKFNAQPEVPAHAAA